MYNKTCTQGTQENNSEKFYKVDTLRLSCKSILVSCSILILDTYESLYFNLENLVTKSSHKSLSIRGRDYEIFLIR